MRPLTAADVVSIWERGEGLTPVEQPLIILASAFPDLTLDTLRDLSLGERNVRLIEVREALYGTNLAGAATCPACQERLEFRMDSQSVHSAAQLGGSGALREGRLISGAWEVRFRPPTSRDLAAALETHDADAARALLVAHCVLRVARAGDETPVARLPEAVIAELAAHMVEAAPGAETLVELDCPACSHRWTIPFDIAAFLWDEMRAHARRLLLEVHTLACAYGWREADILSMSSARRHFYLELVT